MNHLRAALRNSQTNIGALGALLIAISAGVQVFTGFVLKIADGDPATVPDGSSLETALLAIAAAYGLLSARDAGKSTEESTADDTTDSGWPD